MKIDQLLENQSGVEIFHSLSEQERLLLVGQTLKGYKISHLLAVGGMATVYQAERVDGAFDKTVAIKVEDLKLAQANQRNRFLAERQILATLSHPNIAQVLDGGITESGLPYYIMNYIDGKHIDEHTRTKKLDIEQKLQLFLDVAKAIAYAHQQEIIHRDIKPSNIIVDMSGMVHLMDFGIAKQESGLNDLTRTAHAPLTPAYASPEQLLDKPVSYQSDIYQLGLLLHGLLTDRCINLDKTREAIITDITTGTELPAPSLTLKRGEASTRSAVNRLKGDLDAIVGKCLRLSPNDRYDSVQELIKDIENHLQDKPVAARSDLWEYRLNRFLFAYKKPLFVGGLLLFIFGVSISFYSVRLAEEKAFSQAQYQKAKRMTDLVQKLFSPNTTSVNKKSVPTTIDEILENAENQVMQLDAVDFETQVALLHLLAQIQFNLGNVVKASALINKTPYQHTTDPLNKEHFNGKHFNLAMSILLNNRKLSDAESLTEKLIENLPLNKDNALLLVRAYLARATVLKEAGDANRAIEEAMQALTINKNYHNSDTHNRDIFYTMATAYLSLGKFKESLNYLEQTKTLMDADPNIDPEDFVAVYNSMAHANDALGDTRKAIEYGKKNIDIIKRYANSNSEQLWPVYNGLGISYKNLGDYDSALEVMKLSRQHCLLSHGPKHLFLAYIDHTISNIYAGLGNYPKVYFHLDRARTVAENFTKKDHSVKAKIYNNLGGYYRDIKAYDKALKFSSLSYESKLKRLGADSVNVARTRLNVIRNQCALGKTESVSAALAQTRKVYAATYGETSPRMAYQVIVEAECFTAKGAMAVALASYEKALDLRIREKGEDHRLTNILYADIANVQFKAGKVDTALKNANRAITGLSKSLPSNHPQLLDAQLLLGEMLVAQKQLATARTLVDDVSATLNANQEIPEFVIARFNALQNLLIGE